MSDAMAQLAQLVRHAVIATLLALVSLASASSTPAVAGPACTYGSCAPSSTVIGRDMMRYGSILTSDLVASRLNNAFDAIAGPSAAAPGARSWSLTAGSHIGQDAAGADYSGSLVSTLAGVDAIVMPGLLLGVASGYEDADVSTRFNAGNVDSNGYVLVGYGAVALTPALSLWAQLGHTWLGYTENRPGVVGSFDASRFFGSLDLRYIARVDSWLWQASAGGFYVRERQDGYTETNGDTVAGQIPSLGLGRAKSSLGYVIDSNWGSLVPYASIALQGNAWGTSAPIIDPFGEAAPLGSFQVNFEIGAEAFVGNNLSLTLKGFDTEASGGQQSYGVIGGGVLNF
jgi:hypothetical protein